MNSTVSGDDPQAEFKRPESVLVVIYTQAGDALLLQRVRPAWPEFWQSVTGSLHWSEQVPLDAARRELYEETGIELETGWHDWQHTFHFPVLPQYRYRYPPGCTGNIEHVFSLETPSRQTVRINPREHSDSRWVSLSEAVSAVWSWTNRAALDALRDGRYPKG